MKTIYILWLRQVKRYYRSKARIFGSLAQPVLFLLALGYGFGHVFQAAGQGSYLEFLSPGIIGMTIIFTAVFSGIDLIWDRQFGFLKETLVAPVSRFNIMIGRTLGGATMATGQGILVAIIAMIAGFKIHNPWLVIPAILVMFLVAILFTALGTMIASFIRDMQGFQLIMNFLVMPMFFLSGSIFPLQGLPKALLVIATLDPLTYGIDAFRILLTSAGHFPFWLDLSVLAVLTMLFLTLGAYFFSKIEV